MPSTFKNLAKQANDLLNKGFDSANSVKVNTTAANGVKYTTQVNQADAGSVKGKVGASFKHSSGFNVKKLELANNGTLDAQVHLTEAVDNATFTLDVKMKPLALSGLGEKCEVGVEYAHEKAQVTLNVSPILPTAAALSVLATPVNNVLVGGAFAGELDQDNAFQITRGDVGLGYKTGDSTVALVSSAHFQKFTLSGFRQHSADVSFAACVGLDRDNISQAAITVGGTYKVDADTTVKGKINVPNGSAAGATAALGLNHKLNSNVRLTAASTIQLDPNQDVFGANFAAGLEFGSV